MKLEVKVPMDTIDISNALYEEKWRTQAEVIIAIMKGLDSDAVSEIAEWAAKELGMELKWKS